MSEARENAPADKANVTNPIQRPKKGSSLSRKPGMDKRMKLKNKSFQSNANIKKVLTEEEKAEKRKVSVWWKLTRDLVQGAIDLGEDEPVVGPWTLALMLFLVAGSGKCLVRLTDLCSGIRNNADCHGRQHVPLTS